MQNKLAELLEGKTSVAIGGHVRPDGDCVGACMGLYQYLRDNYRDVETDVYLEEIPSHFSFVEGTGDIRHQVDFPGRYLRAQGRPSAWTTISATRLLRMKTISCRTQAPPRSWSSAFLTAGGSPEASRRPST